MSFAELWNSIKTGASNVADHVSEHKWMYGAVLASAALITASVFMPTLIQTTLTLIPIMLLLAHSKDKHGEFTKTWTDFIQNIAEWINARG